MIGASAWEEGGGRGKKLRERESNGEEKEETTT